jgi:CBS domain-containing protein
MRRVQDLLGAKKSDGYYWVPVEASVFTALGVMARHDIGAVLVLDGNKLVGILSERDYARQVVLRGRTSQVTSVGEIMSRDVICVKPFETIDDCMQLMTEHRIRHLPVVERDALLGVISIGDVVKAIMRRQESTIRQLEGYISGVG